MRLWQIFGFLLESIIYKTENNIYVQIFNNNMSGHMQREEANNLLFVGIMALSILALYISVIVENFRIWITLFFLLLLLGSIIFGYVSKNPKKSFFLGFLIWACIPLYITVGEIISKRISISDIFVPDELKLIIIGCTFIAGIISGGVGYFTASTFVHSDKKWGILYRVLSTVLFFILLFITYFLYAFSTIDLF